MIMLIAEVGTLTQTRMGIDMVSLPDKEPIKGQNLFLKAKAQSFYIFILGTLTQIRRGKGSVTFPG